jgi:hypothetical protein
MKITNTLLLIALLTISFANSFEITSMAELEEIKQSAFGKNLLETLSLSLEQGNVGDVENLIAEMIRKLNLDQQVDTDRWRALDSRLKAEIEDLRQKIEKLRKEIIHNLAQKVKYEKLRDQALKNLNQYKAQRKANDAALIDNRNRRDADHADFVKSQAEHTDVLNALSAVLKELKALVGSVSGHGRPVHVRGGAEEARDAAWAAQRNAKKQKKAKSVKKAFIQISESEAEIQAFVELATEADQRALAKLVHYIRKVRNSVRASANHDADHERKSLSTYNSLKSLLEKDNVKLDDMIVRETRNYNHYVKTIAELIKKIAQLRFLKRSYEATKLAKEKLRAEEAKAHAERKAERDEERRVMMKIQEIIKRRLAKMSDYLKKRVD